MYDAAFNFTKIFLQHPTKRELNFYQYSLGHSSSCKWIRDPFVPAVPKVRPVKGSNPARELS